MSNVKIMVNFKAQKVIHTTEPTNSENYQALLKKGYSKVGTIKPKMTMTWEKQFGIFWEDYYFDPKDKYLAP